jgi:hypothetical protein
MEDFVSTESDVVIDVVFDMYVFLREDKVVDVIDLGREEEGWFGKSGRARATSYQGSGGV